MKTLTKSLLAGGSIIAALLVIKVVAAEGILPTAVKVPDNLKLKVAKDRLLASVEDSNGVVKYAYRSDAQINSNPSTEAIKQARKSGLEITNELVSDRTSHSKTFATNREGTYVTEIISGAPQYYKDTNGAWWQAEYATTTKEAFDAQVALSLGERIASIFIPHTKADCSSPCIFGENEITVDGYVARNAGGGGESFSTIYNGAGTTADASGGGPPLGGQISSTVTSSQYSNLSIGILLFDTSSLPDSNTISSATLSLYEHSHPSGLGGAMVLTGTTNTSYPASTTTLAASDFTNRHTYISGEWASRVNYSDFSTGAYNDFILNSTGINGISKAGITRFVGMTSFDYDNSAPTWASDAVSRFEAESEEYTGTDHDPKLVVVHESYIYKLITRKSVNESLSSSAVLQTDDALFLGLSPNKEYVIDGVIFATSSSAAPDLKIGFAFPNGYTVDLGYMAGDDGQYRRAELINNSTTTSQTIQIAGNGDPAIIQIHGSVLTGNSSSTINLLWAQATSNATPTTVLRGSYLRAEQVQ